MQFEWDNKKNLLNTKKHGVNFYNAATIFASSVVIFPDLRKNYGESRFIAIGKTNMDESITLVYTMRASTIRIISARASSKKEREIYEEI